MNVPNTRQIMAKENQKNHIPAPISVKYEINFCGTCVYVKTTLRKVAVAIIEKITAVMDAVSLKQRIKDFTVNSLYITAPIIIAHIPATAADSAGVRSPAYIPPRIIIGVNKAGNAYTPDTNFS